MVVEFPIILSFTGSSYPSNEGLWNTGASHSELSELLNPSYLLLPTFYFLLPPCSFLPYYL